jgi:hypothetical protein
MIKKLLAFLAMVIGTPVVLVFLLLLTTGGIPVPNLNEVENLECYFTQQPKHKFGQIPPTSTDGYWVLFNKRTQFIYVRYWSYT